MDAQQLYYMQKLHFEIDSYDLAEAMSKGEKIQAIDTRLPELFEREHIPGAINLPHRTMAEETTAHLDETVLYVTYCNGIGCNGSTKGALNMVNLGFQVKELTGGLDWWKRDGHETAGRKNAKNDVIVCGC
jgi:rhodanese-related sulfurtransferase